MRCSRAACTAVLVLAVWLPASPPAAADELAQARELMRSGHFAEAASRLAPLAESGDMWAQFQLARLHAAGLGVRADPGRAAELYARSAEGGHREARFAIGWALHTGDGVARDDGRAAHWWRLAARDGHPRAQYRLAQLLLAGEGVPQDRQEAERWLRAAEARNDIGARRLLASLQEEPDLAELARTPRPAPKPAAPVPAPRQDAAGYADAASRFVLEQPAKNYTIQVAATSDAAEAVDFVARHGLEDRAAVVRAGHRGAPLYKALVGLFETRGAGQRAMQSLPAPVLRQGPWLRQLADVQAEIRAVMPDAEPQQPGTAATAPGDGGGPAATVGAGAAGGGQPAVPEDGEPEASAATSGMDPARQLRSAQSAFNAQRYEEAYNLWLPLARDGVAAAQYGVAFLLESGWGNRQDFERAVQWYRAAAEQGHAKAQFNLGLMYLSGQGTPRDDSLAVYWIQSAADNGDSRAREYLNRTGE